MNDKGPTGQRLVFGSFDAEQYWRPRNLLSLPTLQDKQISLSVSVMDHLMAFFCSKGDFLLTRKPVDTNYFEFLQTIGFDFCNLSLSDEMKFADIPISHAAMNGPVCDRIRTCSNLKGIVPWAIDEWTHCLADKCSIDCTFPDFLSVQNVNSKQWSTKIAQEINDVHSGQVIQSIPDLHKHATALLKHHGKLVIKEAYGVSGSGTLLITSEAFLENLCNRLNKNSAGRDICFILEPFLIKTTDFSCQFYVINKKEIHISGIHILKNNLFSFSSIHYASDSFIELIDKRGYFQAINKIGEYLVECGYWGPACIDSMLLADNSLRIVVEINARLSMGFLNKAIVDYLGCPFDSIEVASFQVFGNSKATIEDILHVLRIDGILFNLQTNSGILPIAPVTAVVNSENGKPWRGKFICAIISNKIHSYSLLCRKLQTAFNNINISIVNQP
jgi:hypothetical protein